MLPQIIAGKTQTWGRLRGLCVGLAVAVSLALGDGAFANNRHALVIGINTYANLPRSAQLRTARHDAETMAAALREIGFRLVDDEGEDQPLLDGGRERILAAMARFREAVKPGDIALIYFAGHGVANGRSNFLLPSDARSITASVEAVSQSLIPAESFETLLKDSDAKAVVLVLDACRTDPFLRAAPAPRAPAAGAAPPGAGPAQVPARVPVSSPFTRGLVSVESRTADSLPPRTLIIHSADYDQEALDRLQRDTDEGNGVFTRVFARIIKRPGLGLTEIASRTRAEVMALAQSDLTPKQQLVVFSQNFASGDIHLNGAAAGQPISRRELDRRAMQRAEAHLAAIDAAGHGGGDSTRRLFEQAIATGDTGVRQALALVGDGLTHRAATALESRAEQVFRAAQAEARIRAAGTSASAPPPAIDPERAQLIARDLALAAAIRLPTDARRSVQLTDAATALGDTSPATRAIRLQALIAAGETRRAEQVMTATPLPRLMVAEEADTILAALDRMLEGRTATDSASVRRAEVDPAGLELRNLAETILRRLEEAHRAVLRRAPTSVDSLRILAAIERRRAHLLTLVSANVRAATDCAAFQQKLDVPTIVERRADSNWSTEMANQIKLVTESGEQMRSCRDETARRRAELERAHLHTVEALRLLDRAHRSMPDRRDVLRERALTLVQQGEIFALRGGPSKADPRFREAIRITRRLAGTDPPEGAHMRDLWRGLHLYGEYLGALQRPEDDSNPESARTEAAKRFNERQRRRAVAAHAEGLVLARRLHAEQPESIGATETLAKSLRMKVRALSDIGETDMALRHGRHLLAVSTELHQRDSGNFTRLEQLVRDSDSVAGLLSRARLAAESCLETRTVLATLERYTAKFPRREDAAKALEDFRSNNATCMRVAPVEDTAADGGNGD